MGIITVVGAGPAGLRTATRLRQEGFEVTLIEEHPVVGKPVQCAGLVSRSGAEALKLDLKECIVNEVKAARIFSPGMEELCVKRPKAVAFVLDRFKLDQMLYRQALDAGVEVQLNTKLIDVRNDALFLERRGHGEMRRSKIIVGADGVNSAVRHMLGKRLEEQNFLHSIQCVAHGNFDSDAVELHFGSFAPGFFAWVIPESPLTARIGLAARIGTKLGKSFQAFLEQKKLEVDVKSKLSALIPVGQPLDSAVEKNVLLVGDAAFHTKATTGGGIVMGLKAADACAETIAQHLKHREPLQNYNRKLAPINKELLMHWKIYSFIHSMDAGKLDSLAAKLKKAGIEDFLSSEGDMDNPSAFIGKLLKKPSMWSLAPMLVKFRV